MGPTGVWQSPRPSEQIIEGGSSEHTDSTLQPPIIEKKNDTLQTGAYEKNVERRPSMESAVQIPSKLPKKSRMVVRIEVQDTGVGLRPRDVADNKLFSPYVQTEIGKRQGGKGTGRRFLVVRFKAEKA